MMLAVASICYNTIHWQIDYCTLFIIGSLLPNYKEALFVSLFPACAAKILSSMIIS